MYQTKQIFEKYNNEISRIQYRHFNPTSTLNLNDENRNTISKTDLEDDFISKNIQYYIAGKITPVDPQRLTTARAILRWSVISLLIYFPT
jgi:hypothetical protein